jgi:glycosyltransferase involved in cell wall biosynthesis
MNVGIIMPLAVQMGGGEKTLTDLLENGRGHGVNWTVFFQQDGPMVDQVRSLGIDVDVLPSGRLRELHKLLYVSLRIAILSRQKKLDVLVSWMWISHFCGGIAAFLARKPACWYEQQHPERRDFLRWLGHLIPAEAVFTVSHVDYLQQKILTPKKTVKLIYPGVDLLQFKSDGLLPPEDMRVKLGLPRQGPLIGIVGRMQRWKGMHVLLEAMVRILEQYPDAHCVIVGDRHKTEPDYRDYLEARISELALSDCVSLVGQQSNVPEWMQAMDIVVHASDNEPFGLVIIEAMALGKPVVAGNTGGPLEIISPNVNGLLTPYGDSAALSKAILHYLDNPDFAKKLGVAARQRAEDFSMEQYARNFIASLKSI